MTIIQKLDATGNELPADAINHAILVINGLRIDVRARTEKSHKKAIAECEAVDLLGAKWRSATVQEIFALADLKRRRPAFDKTLFPNFPSFGWLWASDPWIEDDGTASPVYAWGVNLLSGYASFINRHYEGFALPVSPLAAPASQS